MDELYEKIMEEHIWQYSTVVDIAMTKSSRNRALSIVINVKIPSGKQRKRQDFTRNLRF